jgi:hypothetical protein
MFLTLSITDETTSSICALEIAEVVAFASFFVCLFVGVAGGGAGAFVVVVAVVSATLLVVGTDVVLVVVALVVVELGSVETGAGAIVGAASVDGAVTLGVVSVVDVVGAALEFAAAALLAFSFAFSCIEAII